MVPATREILSVSEGRNNNPWYQETLAESVASWSDELLLNNMDRVDARLAGTDSDGFDQFVSGTLHTELLSREQEDQRR